MPETDNTAPIGRSLLDRLKALLPRPGAAGRPGSAAALRWRHRGGRHEFEAIGNLSPIELADLQCIDRQKEAIERNTRQFLQGLPANNVLLWGPRGTGKSSLVKALFNAHRDNGLRFVEVAAEQLGELHDIATRLAASRERFIIFCDDLSFERNDSDFKALKATLDGSLSSLPENVIVYATSNRRHLVPEYMEENLQSRSVDGELHLSETIEQKLSLSERFGIWLAFHPFSQDQYLTIALYWLNRLGASPSDPETVRTAALQWALERGSRSGRSAWQFAKDWTGRRNLGDP